MPVLGIVLGAGTFVVLTTIAHVSTLAALQRERSGQPLSRWEKVVPVALAVLTVVTLLVLIGVAVALRMDGRSDRREDAGVVRREY